MSKTPAFSQLRRALQFAAHLEKYGIATSEGLERAAEAGWSRRKFLKTAATAAASAALMPVIPRLGDQPLLRADAPRVVIVGAGTAGLTAAFRLQQAGVSARVLEASKRVGGRMYTARGMFPGDQIAELGGELIDSGHDALMGLAKELGLSLVDLKPDDNKLSQDLFFFNGKIVPMQNVIDDFRPIANIINTDLATLTGDGDVTYSNPNNGEALDKLSIAEWFDQRKISGVIRSIIDVAYLGEYGLETSEQSSLNLLTFISTEPDSFALYGDSDERYHLKEGSDSLPTQLAAKLSKPVELDSRLEAISQNSGGAFVLSVNQSGKVTDIEADVVVLAIPFTTLRQVQVKLDLPGVKKLAIDKLDYGTGAKVMAGFSTRLWEKTGSDGSSFSDLPYQATWDSSRGQAGETGILTDFLGGKRGLEVGKGSAEDQAVDFAGQMDKVYPGAKQAYNGKAARFHWPTSPLFLGSYACYKPGQYSTIRGAEGEAVGSLHFAGEHTSLDYPGYMNGAVESGERVAQEILEKIKA